MLHAAFFDEADGRLEGDKIPQTRHVNAIAIGVTDLRCAGCDHNAFGVEAIEDAEDGSLERGAADDAVVDDHQVVLAGVDGAVGDVVDVGYEVVAVGIFGDEGPQLRVFYGDLLDACAFVQDALHLIRVGVGAQADDA